MGSPPATEDGLVPISPPLNESLLHGGAAEAQGCCPMMQQGSLWGSVFNLCSATLGAGALALPYAIQHTGILLGLCLLLLTSLATHASILLLVSAIIESKTRSYEDLTVFLFGKKMGLFVELNIIIFCFGTVVAYTMTVGTILQPLLTLLSPLWHTLNRCFSSSLTVGEVGVTVAFWALLMVPLSLVDKISQLQCTSMLGVLSLLYLVLSVMVHAAWSWSVDAGNENKDVQWFEPTMEAFSATAIIMFAFTCQVNVPSLYEELQQQSRARMRAVSIRAIAICLACYACVGVAGYVDFPLATDSNLLGNYDLVHDASSKMMLPAYAAICLTVLVAYPVNIFPCRYALDVMLCRLFKVEKPAGPWRRTRHILLTLLIASSGLVIALYVPGINVVFQLMGGTSSAFVCYMLPAAFAWKLQVSELQSSAVWRAGCILLFFGGLGIGGLATTFTVIGLFSPDANATALCDATNSSA